MIRRMWNKAAVFILLCVATPLCSLFADESTRLFRCKGHVITPGIRQPEVRGKCGEPTNIREREEVRLRRALVSTFRGRPPEGDPDTPGYVKELVIIEEWEYNPGRDGYIRYLTFENGLLVEIGLGGRGYNVR